MTGVQTCALPIWFEVVLVNDGSTDRTLEVLVREFDLYQVPAAYPRTITTQAVRGVYRSRLHSKLVVIDKANGGKADSLNAALDAARYPYVLAVDADTLVESDALVRLARPFLLGVPVAAVGGTIGAGVILLSVLMAAGLSGAAVIATDAVVSIAIGVSRLMVFGVAGAIDGRTIAFALLIGLIAFPGAFLAKAFVVRMPIKVHTAILDAVVLIGGGVMVVGALTR